MIKSDEFFIYLQPAQNKWESTGLKLSPRQRLYISEIVSERQELFEIRENKPEQGIILNSEEQIQLEPWNQNMDPWNQNMDPWNLNLESWNQNMDP